MSAPALRPLRVGEVLDAGIKLYLRNARTLIGLAAVVVVPFQVLSAMVLLSTVSNADQVPRGTFGFSSTTAHSGDPAATAGTLVLSLFGLLVGLLTTAACLKAVSDAYLGHPGDVRASLRFALRRLGSLIWLQIIWLVLLLLACLPIFIPAVWLYVAWYVATPALLIEGCRGWRALRRSRALVRGRWWPTAGTAIVTWLMMAIVGGVVEGVLLALALSGSVSVALTVIIVSLAGGVSSVLTTPLQAAVTTVVYYDLRVRREGYDVALLAEQLGLPAASLPGAGDAQRLGPDSVGQPDGPPYWPPPPGWTPPALDS